MAGEIFDKIDGFEYEGFEDEFDGFDFDKYDIDAQSDEIKLKLEKALNDADITNDFIFSRLMRFKHICKEVLELLLGFDIDEIVYISYQEVFDVDFKSKGVRLDIFVRSGNKIFNVEMQVANNTNLAKRIRFYRAIIDVSESQKGVEYKDLKDTYIIFICKDDPFGEGAYGYVVEPCVRKMGDETNSYKPLPDGTMTLIYNASAKDRPENIKLRAFLDLVAGKDVDHEFTDRLQNGIIKLKHNDEMKVYFMKTYLRDTDIADTNYTKGREEGREEGIELGHEEERYKIIYNMLDRLSNEDIALFTQLTIEEVDIIRAEYDASKE